VVSVTEEEIGAGVLELGRAGLCVEPTAAVVWKGLEHLQQEAPLPPGSQVVLVLSGHGLKAAAAMGELLNR
jgi:threonine synthase